MDCSNFFCFLNEMTISLSHKHTPNMSDENISLPEAPFIAFTSDYGFKAMFGIERKIIVYDEKF
jgi:hypothetical protein